MKIAVASTETEIVACFPIMRELRPHLDASTFVQTIRRLQGQGYHLLALADPGVRAVAGYRIMEMLATGVILYVDDLVTSADYRSKGYGQQLLAWLLREARRRDCQYLELDSGLKRVDAHRFYERNGLEKAAFRFSIPAQAKSPWTAPV